MRRTVDRVARPLVAVSLLAATTVAIGTSTAHAAAATFTKIPTRLYMIPKEHSPVIPDLLAGLVIPIETMKFADLPVTGDVISGQSRVIEISADNGVACNHHATDAAFSLTGCTAVQLDVGHGLIKFDPAPNEEDDPTEPNPTFKQYRFASGALLREADSTDDFEAMALALIGTAAEINQTLQTLVYTPTVDDLGTENVDEDYYYDGSNPETLTVDIVAGNGDPSGGVTRLIDIKVLDYNDFPEIDVPQDQWATTGGMDLELFTPDADPSNPPTTPTLSVTDEDNDEVIDQPQDGDDDDALPGDGDDPDDGEGDEFLVAMWTTCGKISVVSSNGWGIIDDVEHVIDYVYDLVKDNSSDPALKDQLVSALETVLPDEVEQFPFAVPVNPINPTTGFIGVVNDIEALNYSLGRVTFHAVDAANNPLGDATCKVRVLVTDIGNNGLPLHYFGDPPSGLVVPFFGLDLLDTNYVPGVEQLTIQVGAGDPPGEGGNAPTVVSVSDVALAEGDSGTSDFVFTLTLDQPASGDESVMVAADHAGVGDPDTTDGTDLTPIAAQTVSFAPGATTATFTVPVNGDTDEEPDEHFVVTLSNPQMVNIADSSGLGTVLNDDGPDAPIQIIQFDDVSMSEGNSGTTNFVFTIGLSAPAPAGGVVVRVKTNHVTTDNADLTPLGLQAVTFAPGQTSRTVTVAVNGDTDVEPTETFTATLSNPQGAIITPAAQSATGTIVTDDFRHVTSVSDVSLTEGNAGPKTFQFTVTLDGPATGDESVNYATANGTATLADNDYLVATGTIDFAPGDVSRTVDVTVNGDTVPEPNETFTLGLNTAVNLILDDASGIGTIQNDDRAVVSIDDVTMAEGNSGPTPFTFTISLDGPAIGTTTAVTAFNTHGTSNDTDLPLTEVVVPFPEGATTATATFLVNGDTDVEIDDTFTVGLKDPVNTTIDPGAGVGNGLIQNDDGAVASPVVTIGDVSMAEGSGGGTTNFVFTLSLDKPALGTESVSIATNHVTTDATDLTPASVSASFGVGVMSTTVTVLVSADSTPEPDETFTLALSNPVGLLIGNSLAIGTILNDDVPPAAPVVSIGDVSMAEGSGGGTTNFVFTLSLDKAALGTESVSIATNHVTTDATDLTPAPASASFGVGVMSTTVTVAVSADSTPEPDETFTLVLSNPVGLTIGDGSATGTIQDDDAPIVNPSVSIGDVSMAEGSGGGTTNFVFTLSLDKAALGTESVSIATNHVTTDATDLTPAPASASFGVGVMSTTVTVAVSADSTPEPDETFTLVLSNPVGLTIGDGSATGTIQDDDAPIVNPSVSIGDVSMAEGSGGGTTNFVFTLSLDKAALGTESVSIATNHVTTDATDLTPAPASASFGVGVMSTTVTVAVSADSTPEPDETFTLTLSNPVGLLIGDGSATGTIVNDDQAPGTPLTISDQPDITVGNDPGKAGANVPWVIPTAMGGVAPVSVVCSHQPGAFYPLGATTVTCTATDSAVAPAALPPMVTAIELTPVVTVKATATDTFVITVVDVEPPIIADNPDLIRVTSGPPVTVTFDLPAASDNSGVPPVVVCTPVSGTAFAIGVSTVTCTATDGAGHQAMSSFTITVTTDGSGLPATGGDVRPVLRLAVATTVLGALLLLQRRRMRPVR